MTSALSNASIFLQWRKSNSSHNRRLHAKFSPSQRYYLRSSPSWHAVLVVQGYWPKLRHSPNSLPSQLLSLLCSPHIQRFSSQFEAIALRVTRACPNQCLEADSMDMSHSRTTLLSKHLVVPPRKHRSGQSSFQQRQRVGQQDIISATITRDPMIREH